MTAPAVVEADLTSMRDQPETPGTDSMPIRAATTSGTEPTASVDAGPDSPLLRLPAELRNRIYHLSVVEESPIKAYYAPFNRHMDHVTFFEPAVSGSNRQLREETLPIFYGENIFHVRDDEQMSKLLHALGSDRVGMLRRLHAYTIHDCLPCDGEDPRGAEYVRWLGVREREMRAGENGGGLGKCVLRFPLWFAPGRTEWFTLDELTEYEFRMTDDGWSWAKKEPKVTE